jgi:glycosyltransferase involved in cell wall biosynthesis
MKRLLLASYYFPPSGGPGVQRTLKFAKYLREFGWEPTVLTVDPRYAAYPSLDDSLMKDVPAGLDVTRTRSWDPYGAYALVTGRKKSDTVSVSFSGEARPNVTQRFGRWLRGNIFLPDARVGWVPFALRRARRLLAESHYDALMTTGPPHSTHLIGLRLSAATGIPWLADFRDPWTAIDFSHLLPTGRLARRIDTRMERRVLARADRVTTISPVLVDHFRSIVSRRYDVIMNGFDSDDFDCGPIAGSGEFTLSYMGSMDLSRDPEVLWRSMASPALRDVALNVRVIGRIDPVVLDSAAKHRVATRVEVLEHVDHEVATSLMCTSSLLLLVINRTPLAAGIVPGKTFEYIGSGRPVLGIGPTDGDAASVIRESGAGEIFEYDDVEGVTGYISRHVDSWCRGQGERGADRERARAFTRRNRADQLASLLDEMTGGGPDT